AFRRKINMSGRSTWLELLRPQQRVRQVHEQARGHHETYDVIQRHDAGSSPFCGCGAGRVLRGSRRSQPRTYAVATVKNRMLSKMNSASSMSGLLPGAALVAPPPDQAERRGGLRRLAFVDGLAEKERLVRAVAAPFGADEEAVVHAKIVGDGRIGEPLRLPGKQAVVIGQQLGAHTQRAARRQLAAEVGGAARYP